MADAPMTRHRTAVWLVRLLMLLALSFAAGIQPAAAQQVLRDAETEQLLRDISRPLIVAAGLQPENVQVVLLGNREINAFVAGGQIVYLHSGLFTVADNANEVQGVIAHELGHITGGHILRSYEGVRQATGIMILSLLLGAAAMAAGGGEAGMGIIAAGQQAAMGRFLSFTRVQENSADQAGALYLSRAGISGRGSLAFFERLQNIEFRMGIPQENSYQRTHPLNAERIAVLETSYRGDPAWDRPTDPALEARFQRVRAKLSGYVDDPVQVLRRYPASDRSIPAHYARAYAYHRSGHPDEASAEVEALIAIAPHDPYFLELQGQVLLESGHAVEAVGRAARGGRPLERPAPDRRPARPRPDLDRGSGQFRGGQERASRSPSAATTTIPSPGISSASSTTARATRRAPRSPPPSATISMASRNSPCPMPSGR